MRPSGSVRRPSGLEKVSPSISPTRLLPPAASDGSPALRKISQLNLVASGESPSSLNFRIWPCRLRIRGLAGSATRRPLLLVSVQKTALLSGATVSHSRSEEHTSELQSLMRNSYAVFCLKKKNQTNTTKTERNDTRQPQITKISTQTTQINN